MPHSTSPIASDGLEYEDLAQRLLSRPKDTRRNQEIQSLRVSGYEEVEVEAFYKGYDRARGPHTDKYDAGWRAVDVIRRARNRADPG